MNIVFFEDEIVGLIPELNQSYDMISFGSDFEFVSELDLYIRSLSKL